MKFFDLWNRLKQVLHATKKAPFFRVRDVWFCSFGENIGCEQNGKGENFLRPVLIIRKFSNDLFWGIALTTQKNSGEFYYEFEFLPEIKSYAILSQFRVFDAKRLKFFKGRVSVQVTDEIKTRLIALLQGNKSLIVTPPPKRGEVCKCKHPDICNSIVNE